MEHHLTETVYDKEHYLIPFVEMGSWLAYMKDLSIVQKDAGNLLIGFTDKFHKYRK